MKERGRERAGWKGEVRMYLPNRVSFAEPKLNGSLGGGEGGGGVVVVGGVIVVGGGGGAVVVGDVIVVG